MSYRPPFMRNGRIDSLCMETAELVGALSPGAPLAKSPAFTRTAPHKKLQSVRFRTHWLFSVQTRTCPVPIVRVKAEAAESTCRKREAAFLHDKGGAT